MTSTSSTKQAKAARITVSRHVKLQLAHSMKTPKISNNSNRVRQNSAGDILEMEQDQQSFGEDNSLVQSFSSMSNSCSEESATGSSCESSSFSSTNSCDSFGSEYGSSWTRQDTNITHKSPRKQNKSAQNITKKIFCGLDISASETLTSTASTTTGEESYVSFGPRELHEQQGHDSEVPPKEEHPISEPMPLSIKLKKREDVQQEQLSILNHSASWDRESTATCANITMPGQSHSNANTNIALAESWHRLKSKDNSNDKINISRSIVIHRKEPIQEGAALPTEFGCGNIPDFNTADNTPNQIMMLDHHGRDILAEQILQKEKNPVSVLTLPETSAVPPSPVKFDAERRHPLEAQIDEAFNALAAISSTQEESEADSSVKISHRSYICHEYQCIPSTTTAAATDKISNISTQKQNGGGAEAQKPCRVMVPPNALLSESIEDLSGEIVEATGSEQVFGSQTSHLNKADLKIQPKNAPLLSLFVKTSDARPGNEGSDDAVADETILFSGIGCLSPHGAMTIPMAASDVFSCRDEISKNVDDGGSGDEEDDEDDSYSSSSSQMTGPKWPPEIRSFSPIEGIRAMEDDMVIVDGERFMSPSESFVSTLENEMMLPSHMRLLNVFADAIVGVNDSIVADREDEDDNTSQSELQSSWSEPDNLGDLFVESLERQIVENLAKTFIHDNEKRSNVTSPEYGTESHSASDSQNCMPPLRRTISHGSDNDADDEKEEFIDLKTPIALRKTQSLPPYLRPQQKGGSTVDIQRQNSQGCQVKSNLVKVDAVHIDSEESLSNTSNNGMEGEKRCAVQSIASEASLSSSAPLSVLDAWAEEAIELDTLLSAGGDSFVERQIGASIIEMASHKGRKNKVSMEHFGKRTTSESNTISGQDVMPPFPLIHCGSNDEIECVGDPFYLPEPGNLFSCSILDETNVPTTTNSNGASSKDAICYKGSSGDGTSRTDEETDVKGEASTEDVSPKHEYIPICYKSMAEDKSTAKLIHSACLSTDCKKESNLESYSNDGTRMENEDLRSVLQEDRADAEPKIAEVRSKTLQQHRGVVHEPKQNKCPTITWMRNVVKNQKENPVIIIWKRNPIKLQPIVTSQESQKDDNHEFFSLSPLHCPEQVINSQPPPSEVNNEIVESSSTAPRKCDSKGGMLGDTATESYHKISVREHIWSPLQESGSVQVDESYLEKESFVNDSQPSLHPPKQSNCGGKEECVLSTSANNSISHASGTEETRAFNKTSDRVRVVQDQSNNSTIDANNSDANNSFLIEQLEQLISEFHGTTLPLHPLDIPEDDIAFSVFVPTKLGTLEEGSVDDESSVGAGRHQASRMTPQAQIKEAGVPAKDEILPMANYQHETTNGASLYQVQVETQTSTKTTMTAPQTSNRSFSFEKLDQHWARVRSSLSEESPSNNHSTFSSFFRRISCSETDADASKSSTSTQHKEIDEIMSKEDLDTLAAVMSEIEHEHNTKSPGICRKDADNASSTASCSIVEPSQSNVTGIGGIELDVTSSDSQIGAACTDLMYWKPNKERKLKSHRGKKRTSTEVSASVGKVLDSLFSIPTELACNDGGNEAPNSQSSQKSNQYSIKEVTSDTDQVLHAIFDFSCSTDEDNEQDTDGGNPIPTPGKEKRDVSASVQSVLQELMQAPSVVEESIDGNIELATIESIDASEHQRDSDNESTSKDIAETFFGLFAVSTSLSLAGDAAELDLDGLFELENSSDDSQAETSASFETNSYQESNNYSAYDDSVVSMAHNYNSSYSIITGMSATTAGDMDMSGGSELLLSADTSTTIDEQDYSWVSRMTGQEAEMVYEKDVGSSALEKDALVDKSNVRLSTGIIAIDNNRSKVCPLESRVGVANVVTGIDHLNVESQNNGIQQKWKPENVSHKMLLTKEPPADPDNQESCVRDNDLGPVAHDNTSSSFKVEMKGINDSISNMEEQMNVFDLKLTKILGMADFESVVFAKQCAAKEDGGACKKVHEQICQAIVPYVPRPKSMATTPHFPLYPSLFGSFTISESHLTYLRIEEIVIDPTKPIVRSILERILNQGVNDLPVVPSASLCNCSSGSLVSACDQKPTNSWKDAKLSVVTEGASLCNSEMMTSAIVKYAPEKAETISTPSPSHPDTSTSKNPDWSFLDLEESIDASLNTFMNDLLSPIGANDSDTYFAADEEALQDLLSSDYCDEKDEKESALKDTLLLDLDPSTSTLGIDGTLTNSSFASSAYNLKAAALLSDGESELQNDFSLEGSLDEQSESPKKESIHFLGGMTLGITGLLGDETISQLDDPNVELPKLFTAEHFGSISEMVQEVHLMQAIQNEQRRCLLEPCARRDSVETNDASAGNEQDEEYEKAQELLIEQALQIEDQKKKIISLKQELEEKIQNLHNGINNMKLKLGSNNLPREEDDDLKDEIPGWREKFTTLAENNAQQGDNRTNDDVSFSGDEELMEWLQEDVTNPSNESKVSLKRRQDRSEGDGDSDGLEDELEALSTFEDELRQELESIEASYKSCFSKLSPCFAQKSIVDDENENAIEVRISRSRSSSPGSNRGSEKSTEREHGDALMHFNFHSEVFSFEDMEEEHEKIDSCLSEAKECGWLPEVREPGSSPPKKSSFLPRSTLVEEHKEQLSVSELMQLTSEEDESAFLNTTPRSNRSCNVTGILTLLVDDSFSAVESNCWSPSPRDRKVSFSATNEEYYFLPDSPTDEYDAGWSKSSSTPNCLSCDMDCSLTALIDSLIEEVKYLCGVQPSTECSERGSDSDGAAKHLGECKEEGEKIREVRRTASI